MKKGFWTHESDDLYRYGNMVLEFAQNTHLTPGVKKLILSQEYLSTWAERETAVYSDAPIKVVVEGFSTFDGTHNPELMKDIVISVTTTTKEGIPTGRGSMLISRSLDMLLVVFKVAGETVTKREPYFLLTQCERHGVPNPDTLGLLGGAQDKEKSVIQADVGKLLEPYGFAQSSMFPILTRFATIPASVSEEAYIRYATLNINAAQFAELNGAIAEYNAARKKDSKRLTLISQEKADTLIAPPAEGDARPAMDTLVLTGLLAHKLEGLSLR